MWDLSTMILVMLCLSLAAAASSDPHIININSRRASHMVDPNFISFTISPTDLLQGKPFGIGNNLTMTMLKGLAPGYVRLGGPDTNRYSFRSKNNPDYVSRNVDEIIITEEHWKSANEFLQQTGMEAIACINSGHRGEPHKKWDPRNALDLATYSDHMQFNITWQLGYEPTKEESVSGTQLGKDFTQLRNILNAFPRYQQAKIIGPDVRVIHRNDEVENVLDLLIEAGPAVNAVTWHPRWPHVNAVTLSDSSKNSYDFPPDYLEWDRNQLHQLLQRTLLKKPFWIGEPRTEHTGSFAEGIIYARRLINAAKLGIEVVMKEPILNDITHPKAEYWVALMHKKMLGRTVLDTWSLTNQSAVSVAVHCTNRAYGHGQDGGVTVLAVNTNDEEQKSLLRGLLPGLLGGPVHHYALTAGKQPQSIFSQMTYLNGEPLLMTEDGALPTFIPKTKRLGQNLQIKLAPYSIGFWVVPQAQVPACQVEPTTLLTLTLEDVATPGVLKTTQRGMAKVRNINDFLVSKLLNPALSEEDTSNDGDIGDQTRDARQTTTIGKLAHELKDRMVEVKNLIGLNMNVLGRMATKRTNSEEVSLRTAQNKIDKLADELRDVIDGDNQEEEFGKFLELSGLKTNFGKLMMEERQARLQSNPIVDDYDPDVQEDRRKKRDTSFNIMKKYPLVAASGKDLEHLEKRYRKQLEKFHKTAAISDKKTTLSLKKLNKELQEDLLLKEITVLEKTEETLMELMKNHMERYEAIEEMMKDELEEMRAEKLAELLEMKTTPGTDKIAKANPNHIELFKNLLKEQEKVTQKRETKDGLDSQSGPKSKLSPLENFKLFLNQRKEESDTRQNIHEKLLEFRKKFKPDKSRAALKPTTDINTEATQLTSSEIRTDAIKYLSDYIENIEEQKSDEITEESNNGRVSRKINENELDENPKGSVTSFLLGQVLDSIFHPDDSKQQVEAAQVEGSTLSDHLTANSEEIRPELISESQSEEYRKFRGMPANQQAESLPVQPTLGAMPTELLPEDNDATLASSILAQESATTTQTPERFEPSVRTTENQRRKRESESTKTTLASKNDIFPDPHHKTMDGNSIVKKNLTTSTAEERPDTSNVAKIADSALRLVFDQVIPAAYGEAKQEIENLSLPDYLLNLGKIVSNLEHIETLLKDAGNLNKISSKSSSNIQKIKRAKRESHTTENIPAQFFETTTLPSELQQTHSVSIADEIIDITETLPQEILYTSTDNQSDFESTTAAQLPEEITDEIYKDTLERDPVIQEALENAAEEIVEKEVSDMAQSLETTIITPKIENVKMKIVKKTAKPLESDEEPTSPLLATERNIMAMIVENMLKHHGAFSRQDKRETGRFLRPLTLPYTRKARQSASPYDTNTDERVSQFLKQLQPGVYVVPSKDMQNVHAEQTSRTEMGQNGKTSPNVVTLNIYYDKKENEQQQTKLSTTASKYGASALHKGIAANWMASPPVQAPKVSKTFTSLPKLQTHQLAPLATPAPWHSVLQKYYPQYQPVSQNSYSGVYSQPKYQNSPQPVYTPSYVNSKPAGNAQQQIATNSQTMEMQPQFENYWQTPEKAAVPEQPMINTMYDSWPVESKVIPTEEISINNKLDDDWYLQKNPDEYDQKGAKNVNVKHAIEPYWNKTLKEIFHETAKDPFWKFMDAPYGGDQADISRKSLENNYEKTRRKRSLNRFETISAFDLSPFGYVLDEPRLPESNAFNPSVDSNFLDMDDLENYQRGKRSKIDNYIVKEAPHVRYPMENDFVIHRILTRPKSRIISDVNALGPLANIEFVASQKPSVMLTTNTNPVKNYQGNSVSAPDSSLYNAMRPNWQPGLESQLSRSNLASYQNQIQQNDLTFPEAAVDSIADSFPFPLKQMYGMCVEFVQKMLSSTI